MATQKEVGLPGYTELRCRTLEVLKALSMPASNSEIDSAVADAFKLNPAQRLLLHGEGPQTELSYRVAWARSGLVAAGALDHVSRALWRLNSAGREMSCAEVEQARAEYLQKSREADRPTTAGVEGDAGDSQEPQDWKEALCDRLLAMSPVAFERLSGRLLEAAGFDEVQVTGSVADGGIDAVGIYRPSGLISFRTSVQCKRWQGSVGRDRVQAFQGASMPRSDRGIIITTGTFTVGARAQAQAPGAFPVDLIDGIQLAELLKQYGLGVRTTTVELVTLDQSFFADYEETS